MSEFVLKQLFDDVVTTMTALGSTLDHHFGPEKVGRHGLPNQYVWVPTKTRDSKRGTLRGHDKDRENFAVEEEMEVHCWGESHEVALLMRDNLIHAMKSALGSRAPIRFDDGEWLLDDDESTLGRVYILRCAIASVIPDRWTPVARYVRQTPQTATPQTVPMTTPTSAEIRTYSSPDVDTDGELGATDTVTA